MIEELLQQTRTIRERHRKERRKTAEDFNIFTILRCEREEVGTHSRFLYELLSPRGRHERGDEFLKLFVKDVVGLDYCPGSSVTREDPTEFKRRIDLTISSDQYLIGIEIKILAGDQPSQLYDYHRELELRHSQGQETRLLYLTPRGKDPVNGSLKEAGSESVLSRADYATISFAENVNGWLSKCIKLSENTPTLQQAICQYQLIVQKISKTRRGSLMEVENILLESSEALRDGLAVEKASARAKTQIQGLFWEELKAKSNENGVEPTFYWPRKEVVRDGHQIASAYYMDSRNNKHIGLKYCIGEKIWVQINLYNAVHYGLKFDEALSGQEMRDLKKAISEEASLLPGRPAIADREDKWLCCFYDNGQTQSINFDKFDDGAIALIDADERDRAINSIVEHVLELENWVGTVLQAA